MQKGTLRNEKSNNLKKRKSSRYLQTAAIILFLLLAFLIVTIVPITASYSDISECEHAGWEKNFCYREVAKAKNDSSICGKIDFDFDRDWCYREVATITQDSALCEKIQDNSDKGTCYFATIANASTCESAGEKRNWCYRTMAVAKKNISICDVISGSYFINNCYNDVIDSSLDVTQCDRLRDNKTKDWCYSKIGMWQGNESLCRDDGCYESVGITKKDASLCDKIQNYTTGRDRCYMNVAPYTKDYSLCEKISRKLDKETCYSSYVVARSLETSIVITVMVIIGSILCYVIWLKKSK